MKARTGNIRRCALALALCLLAFCAGGWQGVLGSENYLQNGGFEGNSPNASTYGVGATASYVGEVSRSGARSLKIVKTAENGHALIGLSGLQTGKSYEVSAWVRLPEQQKLKKGFSLYFSDNTAKQFITQIQAISGSDGWAEIKGVFYKDARPGGSIMITVDDYLEDTVYYIDDVTVSEAAAPSIVDSSIEDGETGVSAATTSMTVEFDADIDAATVTADNVYAEGAPSAVTARSLTGGSLTLNLSLAMDSAYTIVFENLKTTDGNAVPRRTIYFATEESYKNVITNPGFEEPGSWGVYKAVATRTDECARTGSYSLKVEQQEGFANVKIPLPQEAADKIIRVKAYAAAHPSNTNGGGITMVIEYVKNSKFEQQILTKSTKKFSSSPASPVKPEHFIEITGEYRIAKGSGDKVEDPFIAVLEDSGKAGTFYIDDVYVELVDPLTLVSPAGNVENFGINDRLVLRFSGSVENPGVSITSPLGVNIPVKTYPLPGTNNTYHAVEIREVLKYSTEYTVNLATPARSFKLKTKPRLSVSNIEGGTPVRIRGIVNNTYQSLPMTVAVLLYRDDVLINMWTKQEIIPALAKNAGEISLPVDLPSGEGYVAKLFVFDSFESLQTVLEEEFIINS